MADRPLQERIEDAAEPEVESEVIDFTDPEAVAAYHERKAAAYAQES